MTAPAVPIVLASASPRRLALLRQVGIEVVVVPSDIDETPRAGEAPVAYAERIAEEKAHAAIARLDQELRATHALHAAWVLAADTVVVVDGETLGKPDDNEHARRLIGRLAGRSHEVVTAVAIGREGETFEVTSVRTRVTFRALSEAQIGAYVASGEGHDKAGAYAIQGLGAGLVTRIEGCYTNVVGLPLAHTLGRLLKRGVLASWP